MIAAPFLSRRERFAVVGSTNDVVRGWLADGVPEVCLAVAEEQTAGRGREGRTWTAPPGRAILLSLGFRPAWLAPEQAWRLAAVTSLAMAVAAEAAAGLGRGTIRLKWPNDLVVEVDGRVRKLAGVLGETDGLGSEDPRAVIGIGVNANWPAAEFPAELADGMTSLGELAGRPVDGARLLDDFTAALGGLVDRLRGGEFDGSGWADRQVTTGRLVRLDGRDGRTAWLRALRTDPLTGGLVVEDGTAEPGERLVVSGEIRHLRLKGQV